MKRVSFLLLFFSFIANAINIQDTLSQLKLGRSKGRVFLSGAYHANGHFKCDNDFLQGGRISFTLGAEDYSYTLSEVLGSDDILIKKIANENAVLRDVASMNSNKWVLKKTKDKESKKLIFLPTVSDSRIKKIEMVIDDLSSLKSIYIDFGSHNLAFFAS
ncbi:MAG: hypothetical protein R3A80_02065 [Bdellovibrionota bacterium]